MARKAGAEPIYRVADLFRERCLTQGRSLLWPERVAWTVANASAVWDAFVVDPDEGRGGFFEKWRRQLADQPEDVHRVTADALTLYYLFPSKIGQATKLGNVRRVIAWKLGDEPPDPAPLEAAYATDIGGTGPYYSTAAPWQIAFYVGFARRVIEGRVDPADPVACRAVADEVRSALPPDANADPARHILLHLLFPERFERIASSAHKWRITRAFADLAGSAEDADDALLAIRTALVRECDRPGLDFYDGDIRARWKAKDDGEPASEPPFDRAALQRLIELFRSRYGSFESSAYLTDEREYKLEASRKLRSLLTRETLGELIERGAYEEAKMAIKRAASSRYLLNGHDFLVLHNAPAEPLAVALYGLLYGDEPFDDRFERWVEVLASVKKGCWPAVTYFLMFHDPTQHLFIKPQPFTNLLGELGSEIAWEVKPGAEQYGRLRDLAGALLRELAPLGARDMVDVQSFVWIVQNPPDVSPDPPIPGAGDEGEPPPPPPGGAFEELVAATHLPEAELRELEAIFTERRQLILQGPPGSGKTYVAQKLARYFTGNPLERTHDHRLETVQFHQSYGYEDFVQGIRPETNEHRQLEYRVRDGVFKRFCAVAARNPERRFVMIVDEINRGNVARVFGELLYLLEYRDQEITLPYAGVGEPRFRIPRNVHLIGTMNTTDRSLAQIDYALRRRFYFYGLSPTADGDAPVLRSWLSEQTAVPPEAREDVVRLFVRLNELVERELGEEFQVGHSYFMRPDIHTDAGVRQVWRRAVLPLLEEYFHARRDRADLLAAFSLEALRASPDEPDPTAAAE